MAPDVGSAGGGCGGVVERRPSGAVSAAGPDGGDPVDAPVSRKLDENPFVLLSSVNRCSRKKH